MTEYDFSELDETLLFPAATFKKIAAEHGKSAKGMISAVQASTTAFLLYIIDYAEQKIQGEDTQRPVTLSKRDILDAIKELGFNTIWAQMK